MATQKGGKEACSYGVLESSFFFLQHRPAWCCGAPGRAGPSTLLDAAPALSYTIADLLQSLSEQCFSLVAWLSSCLAHPDCFCCACLPTDE
jgi:hypothetical protein